MQNTTCYNGEKMTPIYLKDTFGIFLQLISDFFVVVEPSQNLVPFVNVQKAKIIFLNLKKRAMKVK
jgi:hypothetical protein